HDAASGVGRSQRGLGRDLTPLPFAERLRHAGERFLVRDVADDGEDGVVWHEVATVEREQVVTGDAGERVWRAALRPRIRVETVDQPSEDGVGDVLRVLQADLQARKDLLPLTLDLGR